MFLGRLAEVNSPSLERLLCIYVTSQCIIVIVAISLVTDIVLCTTLVMSVIKSTVTISV